MSDHLANLELARRILANNGHADLANSVWQARSQFTRLAALEAENAELRVDADTERALKLAAEARAEAAERENAELRKWRERESETQDALQAIGEEFGAHGGEPRTDAMRRLLTNLREERDGWKKACKRAGVCMSCAIRAPETYGCTDCLNTGWDGGSPIEERQAQAAAKAALAKVRGNLEGRDKFIVENGLWDEFVAQLPELSGTKKAPPAEPTGR